MAEETDQTFHYFSQFPPEIRTMMWDAAVQPFPNTHFVDIVPVGADTLRESLRVRFVPRTLNPLEKSRRKDDCNSSYAGDSGVWHACRESHAVMSWWVPRTPCTDKDEDGMNGVNVEEATKSETTSRGAKRRWTFDVERDLFFLDAETFIEAFSDHERIIECENKAQSSAEEDPKPVTLADVANIAIAIKSGWPFFRNLSTNNPRTELVIRTIARNAALLEQTTTIFFYDRMRQRGTPSKYVGRSTRLLPPPQEFICASRFRAPRGIFLSAYSSLGWISADPQWCRCCNPGGGFPPPLENVEVFAFEVDKKIAEWKQRYETDGRENMICRGAKVGLIAFEPSMYG